MPAFREIEHTADLAIEVEAADLPALFACAGEALFALIVDSASIEERESVALTAVGGGPDELLHAWLCELLAQFNIGGFVAKSCDVSQVTNNQVYGVIRGEKINLARHGFRTEIKGVTYHDFKVWHENGQWHARVIFDV
jgi:protein archease